MDNKDNKVNAIDDTSLWVDYVYLDTDERRRFAQLWPLFCLETGMGTDIFDTNDENFESIRFSKHFEQRLRNDTMKTISDNDKKIFIKFIKEFNDSIKMYEKYYINQEPLDDSLPDDVKTLIRGYLWDISVYKEAYNNGLEGAKYSKVPYMISEEEYMAG